MLPPFSRSIARGRSGRELAAADLAAADCPGRRSSVPALPGRTAVPVPPLPRTIPGRPFVTAAEDRLAARRAIAAAAADARARRVAETWQAGAAERERAARTRRAIFGGTWTGD